MILESFFNKYDPENFVMRYILRVSAALSISIGVMFFYKFPIQIMLYTFILMNYASYICLVGNLYYRARLFIVFWLTAIVILMASSFLYRNIALSVIVTVAAIYAISQFTQQTKFQRLYPAITGVLVISEFQMPIPMDMISKLLLSLIGSGILFFILVVLPKLGSNSVMRGLFKCFCVLLPSSLKQLLLYNPIDNLEDVLKEQNASLEELTSIIARGKILQSNQKILRIWEDCEVNLKLLTRNSYQIIYQYNKLLSDRISIGPFKELKKIIEIIIYLIPGIVYLRGPAFEEKLLELREINGNLLHDLEEGVSLSPRIYEILILCGAISHSIMNLRLLIAQIPLTHEIINKHS